MITKTKICPQCKSLLSCTQEPGCWCDELVLSPEVLQSLKAEYDDCLCRECLKALGQKDPK